MRFVGGFILCFCASCVFAAPDGAMVRAAKSLISVQNFPKTFNDLSFTSRMAVLAEGYEPWEAEYDASGRCISGCVYKGMTIEDEQKYLERQTQKAVQELKQSGKWKPVATTVPSVSVQPVVNAPVPAVAPAPAQQTSQYNISDATTPNLVQAGEQIATVVSNAEPGKPIGASVGGIVGAVQSGRPTCSPNQPEIPGGQVIPFGEPVTGRPRMSSPFGERIHPVTGKRSMHRGVDLAVPSGTNIFSPASGRVARVWTDSTCGNGLRITHSDGYETVYCHLSDTIVASGEQVNAGCLVAKSGNTGRSTGPHLHYAIKKNGDYINPSQFLGR